MEKPRLFGITHSNRDFTLSETWGKNQFNSSFPASLVAYLFHKGLDCVYIKTTSDNHTYHGSISAMDLLGISPLDKNTFIPLKVCIVNIKLFS